MTVSIRDSYANMRPIIENHMELVDEARHAFEACGVNPIVQPIRGGTDGRVSAIKDCLVRTFRLAAIFPQPL